MTVPPRGGSDPGIFGGVYRKRAHCYAMPFMRSTEACYINKTYVEKLGYTLPETLTWDFIWEVSEAAAAKKDGNGSLKRQTDRRC